MVYKYTNANPDALDEIKALMASVKSARATVEGVQSFRTMKSFSEAAKHMQPDAIGLVLNRECSHCQSLIKKMYTTPLKKPHKILIYSLGSFDEAKAILPRIKDTVNVDVTSYPHAFRRTGATFTKISPKQLEAVLFSER